VRATDLEELLPQDAPVGQPLGVPAQVLAELDHRLLLVVLEGDGEAGVLATMRKRSSTLGVGGIGARRARRAPAEDPGRAVRSAGDHDPAQPV
jgi:hypothetical protein